MSEKKQGIECELNVQIDTFSFPQKMSAETEGWLTNHFARYTRDEQMRFVNHGLKPIDDKRQSSYLKWIKGLKPSIKVAIKGIIDPDICNPLRFLEKTFGVEWVNKMSITEEDG